MPSLWWIIETTENEKFPYKLSIKKDENTILCLRVQSKWPGAGTQIFCLRDSDEDSNTIEEIERVPIINLNRYGKRLSVVLDRPTNKRCDFLFLEKKYKKKEGEYEQIFWRTQQGLKERKPRVRLATRGDARIHILIDINEKYEPSPNFRGGIYYDIRKDILDSFPVEFIISDVREKFPNADDGTIRRVLRELKEKSIIESIGRGRNSKWVKVIDRGCQS